jgi:hypothetical protein
MKKISKSELDQISEKYPPNRWTKLAFKYFSSETDRKDMAPRKTLVGILMSFFLVGLLGTIFNAPRELIGTATLVYSGILVLLVLFMFIGGKMNDIRIKRICLELGVSIEEYHGLVDKYYQNN